MKASRLRSLLLLLPLLLVAPAALLLDLFGRGQTPHGTYDAIVVAGCRVLESGQASPALARRVAVAVEQWKGGAAPQIILTGGVGTYPPSEAAAAAVVARSLGVPPSALLLEEASTSTRENARFARRLASAERILVVSDSYHVLRARWIFRQEFPAVDAIASVAPPSSRVVGAMREVLALAFYALRSLTPWH